MNLIFKRHFKKILRILLKKILDQLIIIMYKDFRIIFKNMAYEYKNNKDTFLLDHYIRFYLKKSLYYG